MAKNMFTDNLGELYDMQKIVQEQLQQGMNLVVYGVDKEQLSSNDLHFFAGFQDMAENGVQKGIPMEGEIMNIRDFQHVLDKETTIAEQRLEQPLEHLIHEINTDWKMSPAVEEKYYAKVYQHDIQEQMGHDLGNIYTHLIREQQEGKEWVAYPDIEKVSKEDLRTFETREQAQDFVVANSNVAVMYDYNSIQRVAGALEPLVQEKIDKSFGNDDKDPGKDKDKGNDEEMER